LDFGPEKWWQRALLIIFYSPIGITFWLKNKIPSKWRNWNARKSYLRKKKR
jgi:hypothetical protein